MLKNYLIVALRNIFRQKGYSFLNIAGLALGMACSIFLLLQVYDEQSFDKFHVNAKNLYRLEQDQKSPQGLFHVTVTKYPAGPALKESLPEIKNFSRWLFTGSILIRQGDKVFYENGIRAVDPSFLQMFSFPLINGNSGTALNQPFSAILSETMAKKYFGNENPLGKVITFNNKFSFSVTGVMKDAPQNSTLRAGMLIPIEGFKQVTKIQENWNSNYLTTWIELNNDINLSGLNKKITDLIIDREISNSTSKSTPEEIRIYREKQAPDYMLLPLTDVNLYGYFGYGQGGANINSLKIYIMLAFFIILIACINYMNLATARATSRAKEVGLRKTVGADRKHIVSQFFGESILLSFISFIFSLVIVIVLLPMFNDLTEKKFTIASIFGSEFFVLIILVALFAGILAGSYPALFLSSFSPIKVFRGGLKLGSANNFFRKSLVVFQFCLSGILIIGTIVAFQQIQFMRSKQVGYEKDHLIYLPLRGETRNSYLTLKQKLLSTPNVLKVSGSDQQPTGIGSNSSGAKWDGKDPNSKPLIGVAAVDFDFVETMKIEMFEGRPFSNLISTDSSKGFLVNEEVLKVMGTNTGVGKNFSFVGVDGNIIGVMKNFHYTSAQAKIEPLALLFSKQPRYAIMRLKGGNIPAAIENVKSVWHKVTPMYPFEYRFFDEDFAEMYKADERMGSIFKYAAIFAIIIASLGLFGFASYMAEKRTKEIGIRKTLGASVQAIAVLLSKEFVKWVLIANIIAWPAAYYMVNNWLEDYAYRVSIQWWVFAAAAILTILIALLSVSYKTIKAAVANPINSLRNE